jgi:tetratricopeptide (TPR) repeat protein
LNLQAEWRYPVHGLHYPETEDAEQPKTYSAVQLFLERARQVRGDHLLAEEQAAIIRLCQLVEGMPLALELAAAWAKALPTNQIASEIQNNLDFLSTSLRDIPERHQSVQAVFEQTWGRLSEEERRVFRALSVFRGGFFREAAEAVAGVSLRVLSDLVDKSLLRREPDGRYQVHDLLRQYAQTRMESMPEETTRIHDLHSAYYARFLDERNNDLNGGRQRETSLEIEAAIDNIRAAWLWAVERSRVKDIDRSQHPLYLFYNFQSRYSEGIDAFEKAVQILDSGDPETEISLARLLASLGTMYFRRGAFEQAKAALERSWQSYSNRGVLPAPGQPCPRIVLGFTYILLDSNIKAAEQLGQDAFRDHTLREDRFNLAMACLLLAMAARVQGKYEEARDYAQQGYTCTTTTRDEFYMSYCLWEWGMASQLSGDTADAMRHLHASYAIRKDFGDIKGMAETFSSLGRIALLEGDNAEASRCYEQARTIYHNLGNQVDMATPLRAWGTAPASWGSIGRPAATCGRRSSAAVSIWHLARRRSSLGSVNYSCKPESRRAELSCCRSPCVTPSAIKTRKIGHSVSSTIIRKPRKWHNNIKRQLISTQ